MAEGNFFTLTLFGFQGFSVRFILLLLVKVSERLPLFIIRADALLYDYPVFDYSIILDCEISKLCIFLI